MYQASLTHSPIIGVLCIDIAVNVSKAYGDKYHSYIPASYVKFLEGCGALVVPIWIGKERQYYEEIMSHINGVLIPGGAVFFENESDNQHLTNDCVQSSRYIFEIAKEKHANKEYFPIWGTCLGFELLVLHDACDPKARTEVGELLHTENVVKFNEDYRTSRMFRQVPQHINTVMRFLPVAYYYHRYIIKTETFTKNENLSKWAILATDKFNGVEYVTMAEHLKYPFYGVQFHPERVAYESFGGLEDNCDHSTAAVEAAQYLAHFFVNECRRNENKFPSKAARLACLIYNFQVTYTAKEIPRHLQCYLFTKDETYEPHETQEA